MALTNWNDQHPVSDVVPLVGNFLHPGVTVKNVGRTPVTLSYQNTAPAYDEGYSLGQGESVFVPIADGTVLPLYVFQMQDAGAVAVLGVTGTY